MYSMACCHVRTEASREPKHYRSNRFRVSVSVLVPSANYAAAAAANYAVNFCSPNVCLNRTTYEVQTYSYSFQRSCNRWGCRYVHSLVCYFRCFHFIGSVKNLSPLYRLYCTCTNVCNGTMRNVSVRSVDCCEGFASAPSSNEFLYWYHHHHHRLRKLQTEGCPMRTYRHLVFVLKKLTVIIVLL